MLLTLTFHFEKTLLSNISPYTSALEIFTIVLFIIMKKISSQVANVGSKMGNDWVTMLHGADLGVHGLHLPTGENLPLSSGAGSWQPPALSGFGLSLSFGAETWPLLGPGPGRSVQSTAPPAGSLGSGLP